MPLKTTHHLGIFLPILLALGCATTPGRDFSLLSTEQEIQLGNQAAAQVEEKEKILADPALQAYVNHIGERLIWATPRQDVTYAFTVIDAPKTVNAFALPGGHMYIYSGLLKMCENEAELASVMAHEIAHVSAYHHGETLTRHLIIQGGAEVATALIGGKEPSKLVTEATKLFTMGVTARFSREQERQADEIGMDILYRAGYRPDAMIGFMHKLHEHASKAGARPLPIFASHPPTEERIHLLNALVQRYPKEQRLRNPLYAQRYHDEVLVKLGDDGQS